jgi:hypothetical protein
MSLDRIKMVAGSAGPSSIRKPSAQSGTKPLPIPAGRLREKRLKEIKEGILQHNQECRDVLGAPQLRETAVASGGRKVWPQHQLVDSHHPHDFHPATRD